MRILKKKGGYAAGMRKQDAEKIAAEKCERRRDLRLLIAAGGAERSRLGRRDDGKARIFVRMTAAFGASVYGPKRHFSLFSPYNSRIQGSGIRTKVAFFAV